MAEVASAFVSLIPSFQGGGRTIRRELEGLGDEGGRRSGELFSNSFSGAVKGLAGPIAAVFAGVGITQFLGGAIEQASDLNEAGTKLGVVFGDAVGQVNEFAAKGAKQLGQSNLDVLNAAASFGVYGKAAGLSDAANAEFSNSLVQLSTDLASFYNTDPGEAMEALGAGLRGESEPLRAYGVLLDDATLRQKALELGLISTTKNALTPQQRVLAAQASIMEQTSLAQGDFARTSGGLANQQRILAAQFSDLKTNLGTALLPLILGFVTALNGAVGPVAALAGPALSQLNLGISAAAAAFREGDVTSDGFVGAMERAGNAVRGLFELVKTGNFTTSLREGLGVEEDSGIVSGLLTIRQTAVDTFAAIGTALQPAKDAFVALGPTLAALAPQVLAVATSFSPLGLALQALAPVLPTIAAALGQVAVVLVGALVSALPSVLQLVAALGGSLASALSAVAPVLTTVAAALGPALASSVGAVAPVLTTVVGGLANLLTVAAPLAPYILAIVGAVVLVRTAFATYKSVLTGITVAKQAYAFATYGQATAETSFSARAAASAGLLQARAVALYANAKATTATIASTVASVASWTAQTAVLVASRVALVATTVATRAYAAGQWLLNAALAANPIGLVVVAIAALVAGVVLAYKNSETFRNIVSAAWAAVQAAIGAVVGYITGTVVPFLVNAWNSIASTATTVFNGIKDFFAKWWPLLLVIFLPAVALIIALWNRFGDDIIRLTLAAWGLIKTYIINPVKEAFAAVQSGIATAIGFIKGKWDEAVALTKVAFALFKTYVVQPVQQAAAQVVTFVLSLVAAVVGKFQELVAAVRTAWALFVVVVVQPVQQAVERVRAAIATLSSIVVGKITEAFNAAKEKAAGFLQVGQFIIDGLIKGLSNGLERVKAKAREIAEGALSAAKKALGIQSPSRAFIEVGEFINEGLVIGLSSTASKVESTTEKIADNIYKGFKDIVGRQIDTQVADIDKSVEGLKRQIDALSKTAAARKKNATLLEQLNAQIKDLGARRNALNDSIESVVNTRSQDLLTAIASQTDYLGLIARNRDAVAEDIKAATKNLEDAVKLRDDFATSIADSAAAIGALTSVKGLAGADGKEGAVTFDDIVSSLSNATISVESYRSSLETLRNQGLNDDLFKQLADAGATQGKAYVDAIIAAGPGAVAQLNQLQTNLGIASQQLGDYTSKQLYQAGVDSAQGLLDGLKSREANMYALAEEIANGIAERIRKALDIHSPSRVMATIGEQIGAGLAQGIEDSAGLVGRAADDLFAIPAIPSPRVAGAVRPATGLAGASSTSSAGGAAVFNLYDADDVLIGTMSGVATGTVSAAAAARTQGRRQGSSAALRAS